MSDKKIRHCFKLRIYQKQGSQTQDFTQTWKGETES